jgi:hypothetical protein
MARRSRTWRPLRRGVGRRQVVGAVVVDRVDLLQVDELLDVDRLRARERHRLEVRFLDHHELALGELPALDELVRLDVALVERAPALLLDRRAALAMERPEGHVLALLRHGEPDRDVDQAEVDGAVPDRSHEEKSLPGPGIFALGPEPPAQTTRRAPTQRSA